MTIDDVCGLCLYYKPNGGRTIDGAIIDCCTYGVICCDSKSACIRCRPKRVSHMDIACDDMKKTTLDWYKIMPLLSQHYGEAQKGEG